MKNTSAASKYLYASANESVPSVHVVRFCLAYKRKKPCNPLMSINLPCESSTLDTLFSSKGLILFS